MCIFFSHAAGLGHVVNNENCEDENQETRHQELRNSQNGRVPGIIGTCILREGDIWGFLEFFKFLPIIKVHILIFE